MPLQHKINRATCDGKIPQAISSLSQVVPIHGLLTYCIHTSNSGTAGGSHPGCGNPGSIWSWALCAWSSEWGARELPFILSFSSLISNPEFYLTSTTHRQKHARPFVVFHCLCGKLYKGDLWNKKTKYNKVDSNEDRMYSIHHFSHHSTGLWWR